MMAYMICLMVGVSIGTVIAALAAAGGSGGVTHCRHCRHHNPDGSCSALSTDDGAGPGVRVYTRPGDYCSYGDDGGA